MDSNKKRDTNGTTRDWYHVSLTFIISCMAWPMVYIFHSVVAKIPDENERPIWSLILCIILFFLVYLFIRMFSKTKDYLYYLATSLAFSSMGSLILFLEMEGFVSNFVSEYLLWVEPYLDCAFGSALLLYDGTVFYTFYLLLAFSSSNGLHWRPLKLYWSAGIAYTNVVLILAALVGKHDFTLCITINFAYFLIPAVLLFRELKSNPSGGQGISIRNGKLVNAVDIFLVLGLVISVGICTVKAMAVISYPGTSGLIHELLKLEPVLLLRDPAPFTVVQSLNHLFYLVPLHLWCIGQLIFNWKPRYSLDAALILAGIIMTTQFIHIVTALHPRTGIDFRSDPSNLTFWLVNVFPVVITHLLVYRVSLHRNKGNSSVKEQ